MSNLVYLCMRHSSHDVFGEDDIAHLSARLTPDNIIPAQPRVIHGNGILIGIINPLDCLPVEQYSVCLGALIGHPGDWWQTGATPPDGSYALFRGDHHRIELLSDAVASRTIWYAKTDSYFIASTSQRAIVYFLMSYRPNADVNPWMLSSGALGPGLSWDRRISCVPANSRLLLDRDTWETRLIEQSIIFSAETMPDSEHESRLQSVLQSTFDQLDIDPEKWILPLSGGYDSRAILLHLGNKRGLRTVTWGVKSSLQDKDSDASVARDLARHHHLDHQFMSTEIADLSIETIFSRFLTASEGRSDHVSAYMDGFHIWALLHQTGCQGVIRGDEAFGWKRVSSEVSVRQSTNLLRLCDYRNLDHDHTMHEQIIPDRFRKDSSETLDMWRDRIYQTYRIPVMLSALNDAKCRYVEVINPLLSRSIMDVTRTLPDHLRNDKILFRKIIARMCPGIRFATRASIASPATILSSDRVVREILRVISDSAVAFPLTDVFMESLLQRLKEPGSAPVARQGLRSRIKGMLPEAAVTMLSPLYSRYTNPDRILKMDLNRLAFRVYILTRMNGILAEDASAARGLTRPMNYSCSR